MITLAQTKAQEVWRYYRDLREQTYTVNSCRKLTMQKFRLEEWQLDKVISQAKVDNTRQAKKVHSMRKAEQRKKTGPPIVTRDQLLADLDEMHDLPRTVRVARVASYYGLTSHQVNSSIGWNAEVSGKSNVKVYEPTAEEIAEAAAKIRAGWSATERAARPRWAKSAGVELIEVAPVGCMGGVED